MTTRQASRRPAESRRRPWLVVIVIGWSFTIATGLGFYALALYTNALVTERGFTLTTVSFAVSTFFLASAIANVPLGWLVRRVEPRWIMLGGAAACGLSLLLLGRLDAVWQLYLDFTVFGCAFSAASFLPGTAVIVARFSKDRAKALAVALTGASVGGVVVAPLLARILDAFGLAAAAPWLGLAYLILGAGPVVAVVRGHLDASPVRDDTEPGAAAERVTPSLSYAQAVTSAAFVLATVCFAILMADQTATQVQIVSIGTGKGVDAAGIAVSIMAFATLGGRLLGTLVLHRVSVVRFSAAIGVLQGVSFAALAVLPGLPGLTAGTVLFGITVGNLSVLIPLVIVELFGLADYPRIYALSQFGVSLGGAGGPALLAVMHGGFGTYRMPLLILAVISALAAVALARLRPPGPAQAARRAQAGPVAAEAAQAPVPARRAAGSEFAEPRE
ncbi:MAG TPA: MFS transporter [Streptosporangiaceae bacterium]